MTTSDMTTYTALLPLLVVVLTPACVSSNYDTSMVHRLMQDRDVLIQDGLSYFNGTTLHDVIAHDEGISIFGLPSVLGIYDYVKQ